MRRLHSIRVRLTLWYTFVLFAGLVILGSIMWIGVEYGTRVAIQQRLADRLEGIVQPVASESRATRSRLRSLIDEPEAAIRLIPEAAGQIRALQTEEEWEQFVTHASHMMAEGRMREIADVMPPGEYLEVRTLDGQVVASTSGAEPFRWPDTLGEDPYEGFEFNDQHYLAHKAVFEVVGRQYVVFTASSLEPLREATAEMRAQVHWGVLAFLLLSTLGGWMIASRALRPVDEITRAARSISIEDLSHRLEVPKTGDEIERLAATWNGMLERLDKAVGRLSQFTADASHELRTPTAVIRTTAELALRKERPVEDYREALEKVQREAGRMSQLVEDLLVLARADADLDTLPMSTLDLGILIRDVCQDFQVLAQVKPIEFDWQIGEGAAQVRGSDSALRRLLIVLLDNAIKYTPAGGSVRLKLETVGSAPVVEVRDSGVGIPGKDLPKIFDRFYRADPARGRAGGSHGLGLAVGQWIAGKHGARIDVESVEGQGSVFRVVFPRAPERA